MEPTMTGILAMFLGLSLASAEPEERQIPLERLDEPGHRVALGLAAGGAAAGYGSMAAYAVLSDKELGLVLVGGPPAAALGATAALRFSAYGSSSVLGELGGSVLGAGLGFVTGIGLSIPLVLPLMESDGPSPAYAVLIRSVQIVPPVLGASFGGWLVQNRVLENRSPPVIQLLPYGTADEAGMLIAGRF
jgi:hypothetical protein